jgi:hypothetical protein
MTVDSAKLEIVGKAKFLAVVDAVNRSLTQDAIVGLNAAVTNGQSDVEVSRRYLRDAGLLEPNRTGGN